MTAAETSQPNPFADEPGPTQPSTAPATSLEPETGSSTKAAVMEMVGGLETEMERMDIAKSPTVPKADDPESSDTESETESAQEPLKEEKAKENEDTKDVESDTEEENQATKEQKEATAKESSSDSDSAPASRRESTTAVAAAPVAAPAAAVESQSSGDGYMTGGTAAGLFGDAGGGKEPPKVAPRVV